VKLVVGLGNPGPRYAGTRHNAGFLVAERFAADCGIALGERRFEGRFGEGLLRAGAARDAEREVAPIRVGVLEPETYMNCSGDAVDAALGGLAIEDVSRDLLIVLDDMDLPFGRLRLRPGGGAGGHRGLSHILERLECQDVARLRFGVGRPREEAGAIEHVLECFSSEEELRLPGHVERAARAVAAALSQGVTAAMNLYNCDPSLEAPGEEAS
jgi:PTH1 family peptidyl-tRNA hydrolase